MEELKSQWSRIGFRFLDKPSKAPVDLERLIVETTRAGRQDPVLLSAMLTWIIHFSDLINTARLLRLLKDADLSVLGLILDLSLEHHAHKKLKQLILKFTAKTKPEILFSVMDSMVTTRNSEIENSIPAGRKWGLFVSDISIKADALHNRDWILKRNPNLYFRALFGANIKAEVFSQLFKLKETYIQELSRAIGVSYQPVYAEVKEMAENHFLNMKSIGRTKLISMNPLFNRHFQALLKGV
jgi:hypothetical protein